MSLRIKNFSLKAMECKDFSLKELKSRKKFNEINS